MAANVGPRVVWRCRCLDFLLTVRDVGTCFFRCLIYCIYDWIAAGCFEKNVFGTSRTDLFAIWNFFVSAVYPTPLMLEKQTQSSALTNVRCSFPTLKFVVIGVLLTKLEVQVNLHIHLICRWRNIIWKIQPNWPLSHILRCVCEKPSPMKCEDFFAPKRFSIDLLSNYTWNIYCFKCFGCSKMKCLRSQRSGAFFQEHRLAEVSNSCWFLPAKNRVTRWCNLTCAYLVTDGLWKNQSPTKFWWIIVYHSYSASQQAGPKKK